MAVAYPKFPTIKDGATSEFHLFALANAAAVAGPEKENGEKEKKEEKKKKSPREATRMCLGCSKRQLVVTRGMNP